MRLIRDSLRFPVVGYGWVRLLPMGCAVGFIALLHVPQVEPSGWDWLIAVVSAGLVPAGGRHPVQVALVQCALLGLSVAVSAQMGGGVAQILACVALGEVALRRPGPKTWWSAAAVGAASGWNFFPHYSPAANLLTVLLDVGLPLLLGSFLRSLRQLAEQAEQRALEAERDRDWGTKVARAAERAAVARELHDVVAHHVASIVLRVGVVRHVVPSVDPRLDDALEDVHAIGGQALTDLRRLVSVLRDPDTVGEPVLLTASALSAELATVVERTRQAGASVETAVDAETVDGLDTAHRHAVLRLVQEGLTNALKHAGRGVHVRLVLRRDDDGRVRAEVSDDGAGAGTLGGTAPGHGLLMMRERLELLGGELHVGPCGTGWSLRAVLPDAPSRAEVTS
ncbi:sensor histidine kinase [Streptomyces albidus (ex Kaewkla and Franco 2022)]|uniref:sensor histidine kinase n=1 Tax=Streptomyces albidus (ex Kaewkla and Franco 2022) TaxID=722709 RepID=UPI0015EFB5FC|nr:histidine kinase [Streptomyces albidus (ex Kaewkla and Franco 2022)]